MQIEYRRRPAVLVGTYTSTNTSIHTWARSNLHTDERNRRAKHRGSSLQIHPSITVSQLSPVNWIHPWTHSKLSFIIRRKMRRRTDLIWVMIPTHTRLCNAWANGTNAHSFPTDWRPASPTHRLPHHITTVKCICLDSRTLFELGNYGSCGKFSLGNEWCSLHLCAIYIHNVHFCFAFSVWDVMSSSFTGRTSEQIPSTAEESKWFKRKKSNGNWVWLVFWSLTSLKCHYDNYAWLSKWCTYSVSSCSLMQKAKHNLSGFIGGNCNNCENNIWHHNQWRWEADKS